MYVAARSGEVVLTESRTLRQQTIERTDVLDRVKLLTTLPNHFHATTEMVASYYEVPLDTIKSVVEDNAEELAANGRRVLRGTELVTFARPFGGLANLGLHHNTRSLAIFSRRTILNVGQLLTRSEIARQVRTELLNAEAQQAPTPQLPTNFAEALELAATLARQNEKAAAELQAAAPKIEAHDRLIESGGDRLIRVVAAELGVKEQWLRGRLLDWRWIYRKPLDCGALGYHRYANQVENFSVKEREAPHNTRDGCWHPTLYVTAKGREAIRRKLDREQTALQSGSLSEDDPFEREGGAW
jgi:phage antirepressor YoqD-like protein